MKRRLPETVLPQIQQQQQTTKTPLAVLAYSQDNTIKLDEGALGLVNNEILQTTVNPAQGEFSQQVEPATGN